MDQNRIDTIKTMIMETGYLNLAELSRRFNVSESTVRRDLQRLEKQGVLTRNHGGAVITNDFKQTREPPAALQAPIHIDNLPEKEAVAREAAKMVADGDFIAIGSGTTCLVFARALTGKNNLKIITNNVLVALELSSQPNLQVIISGGVSLFRNNCVNTLGLGDGAFGFGNIMASKIFCSVLGIDFGMGYTDISFDYLDTWKSMLHYADRSILLTTSEKFGKRGFVTIAGLDTIDEIVTTPGIPPEYLTYYNERNIAVHTAQG